MGSPEAQDPFAKGVQGLYNNNITIMMIHLSIIALRPFPIALVAQGCTTESNDKMMPSSKVGSSVTRLYSQ